MEQMKSPEIDPYKFSELIFDKGLKTTMEKRQSLQQIYKYTLIDMYIHIYASNIKEL